MSAETGQGSISPIPLEPQEDKRDRRRRRRHRDRQAVALDPARDAARARKRLLRRVIALTITLGIVAAVAVPIALWRGYETTYVTSRNATVKGSITHVGAQLSGVIASVEVDAGQQVTAGQVLARFEDHQLRANVARARARLVEAEARSTSALARIDAAQVQTREARVRHEQRIPLAENGVIPRDELRQAEARAETAEALERTAIADHHATSAEVTTAEAELAVAEADLEAAVIRAPADGWVLRRISEPGASIVVGSPIIDLWIGKEIWVEAWIDEDDLGQIAVGNQVEVTVNSFPGRTFRGMVASIGASTDFELPETAVPQSRSERMRTTPVVPVRVQLDEREGLLPGLSAMVAIQRAGPSTGKVPGGLP